MIGQAYPCATLTTTTIAFTQTLGRGCVSSSMGVCAPPGAVQLMTVMRASKTNDSYLQHLQQKADMTCDKLPKV